MSAQCPRCKIALRPRTLTVGDVARPKSDDEVTVLECDRCRGQLFERKAFVTISETHVQHDPDLSRIPEPGAQMRPVDCPQCRERDGEPREMCKVKSRREASVTMDVCTTCSAIWLDVGELDAIRGREETFARAAFDWVKSAVKEKVKETAYRVKDS